MLLLEIIAGLAAGLVVYHHFVYPLALREMAARARAGQPKSATAAGSDLPSITLVVPAHNEQAFIARKIENLLALTYPRDRLEVVIACDGCTDQTRQVAEEAIARDTSGLDIRLAVFETNLGKVAVINNIVADASTAIVALSDASSLMAPDALNRAARHFADPAVGVVCPTYKLSAAGSEGERAYWAYQTRVKADEAAFGAPIGAHGAFYLFRRDLWEPLAPETINDDVILPMSIVAQGYRAVYDTSVAATEMETTRPAQEWRRRVRIGAGNMQQVIRLWSLSSLNRPGLAFVFLSGKTLRVLTPYLVGVAVLATLAGAALGSPFLKVFLAVQCLVAAAAIAAVAAKRHSRSLPRPVVWLGYLAEGHTASFIGSMRYLLGHEGRPWSASSSASDPIEAFDYIPMSVVVSKKVVDIACGLGAFAVMLIVFVPIAIIIKLESPGPIFYRQLRVGRITPTATYLFYLIKFRTMRADAEAKSGAVWASKNDPRITRFGNFMRKTRLDELPQCINVLLGEMSVVGPRPERPSFFMKLEDAIPFYAERTYGLKPGITGLAQINQAYDQSIEDVRNKVLYDHAYAARISTWKEWARADFGICLKTFTVMVLGKGQ